MKVLNELHLPTAKIIVARKSTKSLADLSKYRSGIEDSGLAFKDILYVDLEAENKSELREAYQQLIDLCRTQGIYTVIDDSHTMRGKQFIKGMIFSDIFGKDSSLWKNLGVYYHDDIKWICGTRWESAKRECESSELVDSEFKIDSSKLNIVKIDSVEGLKKIIPKLAKSKMLSGDIETNTLRYEEKTAKILTVQWTPDEEPLTSYVLMYDHPKVPVSAEYKKLMKDLHQKILTKKKVAFHNGLFDLKFLCRFFEVEPLDVDLEDTYVMHRLLNNSTDESGQRLKESGLKLLAYPFLSDWDSELEEYRKEYCAKNKIKKDDFTYDLFPVDTLVQYAGYDTIALRAVYYYLLELNKKHKIPNLLENSWYKDWKRITVATTRMVMNGIPIDLDKAKKTKQEFIKKIEELDTELQSNPTIKNVEKRLAKIQMQKAMQQYENKVAEARKKGKEFKGKVPEGEKYGSLELFPKFNASSSAHKACLLFDELKLKPIKFSESTSEPSADKYTFEHYMKERSDIPVLALFNEISKYQKELTAYLDPWITIAENSYDGRVHADWFLDTVSFRYVSKKPNLQQLKRDSDLKKLLAYKEGDGRCILQIDYSALENRLGIILDKDPNKLKLFNSGIDDEHSVNAITSSVSDAFAVLRGLDPTKKEDIVKVKKEYPELRSSAKKITFLAQYLGTHYKLIKELGVDEPTAKKMMESYWNFRQGTKDFINSKLKFYTENGYTVVFGGVPVQIHGIDVMKGFNTLDDYQDHISKVPDKGPYLDAMSAFRTAFNSETQSGAWATKRAMVNMNDWIRETGTDAKIIMEVHDALYLDVAISDLEETYQAVSKFMKEPIVEDQVIPLDTESEVGLSVKGELGIYEGEERKEILEKLRSF